MTRAGIEQRQHLQRFSQAHFIGENPAETIGAKKSEPRHAVLLIGAQNGFERAQRNFGLHFATLLCGALRPGLGRGHLPAILLPKRGVQKTRLRIGQPVALRILFRRAIKERFLKFLHCANVQQCEFAVAQLSYGFDRRAAVFECRQRRSVRHPACRKTHSC